MPLTPRDQAILDELGRQLADENPALAAALSIPCGRSRPVDWFRVGLALLGAGCALLTLGVLTREGSTIALGLLFLFSSVATVLTDRRSRPRPARRDDERGSDPCPS